MKYFKLYEDYTSYMKPYQDRMNNFFDSIKSFNDIDEETIIKFIDYCGYEGFNDEEDAIEDLTKKIEFYKSLPNPCTLYRVVGVDNEELIRKDDLGQHYTPHKWAIDSDMLMMIGSENWSDDVKAFIIEVSVPLEEIDIKQTIIQNLSFPTEHEINLKNNGKNVKVVNIEETDLH